MLERRLERPRPQLVAAALDGWHHALKIHRGYLEWPNGTWTAALNPALFCDLREAEKAVFDSTATNLVPHDTNRRADIFVRSR